MTGEIECNEEMIKYQEESRSTQFMEEIQSLEERMMSFPPTPATMSVASMAGTTRRERRKTSLQLGLEPQTARQMVAKVKQQYEAELQSLQDHQAKENQRHQAELRRLEQEHKKDLQNIHKESLQLLRALNRFKDGVASLLDRESKFNTVFISLYSYRNGISSLCCRKRFFLKQTEEFKPTSTYTYSFRFCQLIKTLISCGLCMTGL